ncbi:hypothetical protein L226DRAFT_536736 [Lentinus tigrinus ALCF2SS1-7]|uniref:[histone H3]-trimethyl-L-lysine(9) demethylase n=1 Tax=Lentinus tigrinus ALCF2SS1-6 TaxID=1328759 RepID=A0A5C2S3Y4_9APHY|nr:hypothetical protein L227DRAFT_613065 [Lentinus tigrinus ALCF2SS1-6]RPD72876.1 hypothetical protein L226DRAFT_536736 [Lentinus tigrinus ALCF2SS1-7]
MATPGRSYSRSPSPTLPAQPDHFYGNENIQLPPSPNSDGRTWLDPADDPAALRGIPVFKPTMAEFEDFEEYMTRVEPWGMRSGIVKIIPPKEWTERLPSVVPQLDNVRLKNPIEQHMLGQGGLFQQQNIEKRRLLSVREWFELCAKEEFRAPGVDDVGLHARANNGVARTRRRTRRATADPRASMDARGSETAEPESRPLINVKHEHDEELVPPEHVDPASALISPPNSNRTLSPVEDTPQQPTSPSRHPAAEEEEEAEEEEVKAVIDADENVKPESIETEDVKPKRGRRPAATRETKEAQLAERAERDREWLQTFEPHTAWLPPKTSSTSYNLEFCKELERRYWRNCGFGKPPWYGADMQGSLFTTETTSWNVACLPSALTRLLPASSKGLPGVNTPYLYFGMWRATFAWHVEDMDLFSINYIHFGAPKFWYAMPQARANALEQTMRSIFPGAGKNCTQFLRHKSYLASPNLLAKYSCKPNYLVQQEGEFVITFPRGYHAGFNLGFNCAESVNFALESWIDIGRKAKACDCVNFSVRIDVDQLLQDRAAENRQVYRNARIHRRAQSEPELDRDIDNENKTKLARKRKSEGDTSAKPKRRKTKPPSEQPVASSSKLPPTTSLPPKLVKVTLKLPPPPPPKKEPETFPCCLCVSMSKEDLLRVQDPPAWWYDELPRGPCMAHVECAMVIPETWIDEVEVGEPAAEGVREKEQVVFGVDGIVKDRWNLKCTACTKAKNRAHGAPIQCTKGKCPKAFHVSCARDGHASGIVYKVVREVEKEVVLLDSQPSAPAAPPPPPPPVLLLHPDSAHMQAPVTPAYVNGVEGAQPMEVDPTAPAPTGPEAVERYTSPSPRVLKTIRKTEVEVLCHQHNPAVLAAKKVQQQDRIRNALLALPPMSRIKLRVTAGVFEVTLVRIIEETGSVEVLWDRGVRREFKWRSVVFGDIDGVVGQKPSEAAPEPERLPVPVRASYPPPATPAGAYGASPSPAPTAHTPVHMSPPPVASGSTQQQYAAQPRTNQYQPTPYHQPGSSTYQYPGSWAYQYRPPQSYAPPPAGQSAQPAYLQPPPQSAYGQPPSSAYYPYTNQAGRPTYPYPQYGGYGAYPPAPPPNSQPQPQPQPQSQPQPQLQLQPQPPPQPQPQPQPRPPIQKAYSPIQPPSYAPPPSRPYIPGRGLQWQQPYTGPKEPAQKTPPSTVPIVAFPPGYAAPAAPAPASGAYPYPQTQAYVPPTPASVTPVPVASASQAGSREASARPGSAGEGTQEGSS